MKRIKKIFKFVSYTLLFLLVAIGSAYGVITMSLNNAANKANKQSGSAESNIPEEITSLVNNIMTSPALEAEMQINVLMDDQELTINVSNGKIDLSQGLDNLIVDADISVEMLSLNNQIEFGLQYQRGNIYIDGFNNKFKLETENLISSITQLTSLFNIELPDFNGFDMGALDVNSLLGALKIVDEVETDDGVVLNIEVPAINTNITLLCNKDFKLQNISIPSLNFNGIEISLNGEIAYPEEVEIDELEQETYVNLSSVLNYAENFKVFNEKSLGFDFDLNYLNHSLDGELTIDLDTLNFMIEANTTPVKTKILMIDSVLYVEFGNLYAKFDIKDLDKLQPILDRFNIDFTLDNITKLIGEFKENGIKSVLGLLKNNNFDLNNLDLSTLEDIATLNDKLTIQLKNVGDLTLVSNENGLNEISLKRSDLALNLKVKSSRNIDLATSNENYVDLSTFIPLIDDLTNIIKNQNFDGNIVVKYKDVEIAVNYQVSLDKNLHATFDCNVFGRTIKIILQDKQLFVNISNTFVKVDLNNISQIFDQLSEYFDLDLDDFISNIKDMILRFMDQENEPLLIKGLNQTSNGIEISLVNNVKLILNSQSDCLNFNLKYNNLSVKGVAKTVENVNIQTVNQKLYTDIEKLLPIIGNTYNYIKDGKYYARYNFKTTDLTINGGINLEKNNIFLICNINYKGLNGTIGLSNGKIYASFKDIHFSFDIADFEKLENLLSQFDINLNELNELLNQNIGMDLKQILNIAKGEDDVFSKLISPQTIPAKLETILNKLEFSLSSDKLSISYDQKLNANVKFENNIVNIVDLEYNNLQASITLLDEPYTYTLNKKYIDCGKLIDLTNNLIKYFKDGKIDIDATLSSSSGKSLTADIQADYSGKIKLNADISSNLKEDINASINIDDGMTYLNVNGLLFKLNNESLKEILYIALNLFNIDTTKLNILKETNLNLDLTELKSYIPTFDTDEIIKFVNMIKNFEKKSNNYVLTIDGSALLNNQNSNSIVLTIITNGLNITGIKLENIYTSSNLNEKFNIEISLNNLMSFKKFDKDLSYIDISDSTELLKAVVNMTQAKTFNIKGSVDLQGDLIGIKINRNIGFDIKINVTTNRKLEVYGIIGVIPTLVGVNNDVPYVAGDTNSGSDRYLKFYYKDGFVYLYRSEKVDIFFGAAKRTYEKCVKISLQTLLNDPLKYMQYGLGLTDKIMDEIKSSSEKAKNRSTPIDYSKIIKSFTSTESSYTLNLNMAEILNNSDVDQLSLTLKTSTDTNNKKYISDASFTLSLPLSKVFKMKLSSSDIKLVGYNTKLDMSNLHSFIEDYKYNEGEFWQASKGDWNMAQETVCKLTFVTNSHQTVDPIEKKAGQEISLPNLNSYSTRSGDYRTYYTFEGWYFDENFKTKFVGSTMPGADYTLYAKWNKRVERVYNYEDLII